MSLVQSRIRFSQKLPPSRSLDPRRSILIYDRILERNPGLKTWLRDFSFRYPVHSGEQLKNLAKFPGHMQKILRLASRIETRPLRLICVGGGSVGDFGGFVASILHRGIELVHLPSTWLSAIDSAHGGKTALNVASFKNQIGTFYPAHEIHLCRPILRGQPQARLRDAFGEALKIALISGGPLWRKLREKGTDWDEECCWSLLPEMVESKYRIVRRDPREKKGLRQILNLGHTMGHVLEAQLGLSHGTSVLYGLAFMLEWSRERGLLTTTSYTTARPVLPSPSQLSQLLKKLKEPRQSLLADKKRGKTGQIRFVFLAKPGRVLIQEVGVQEILAEMGRQARLG